MLFGLFGKKKKLQEEISFNDLDKWISENQEINDSLVKFDEGLKNYFSSLDGFFEKIEPLLQQLEKVNLENRKEEVRLKEIVLSNRTAYIGYVRGLLRELRKEINLAKEQERTFENVEKFTFVIFENLNRFSVKSFNAFQKASGLIGNELKDVSDCIAEFGSLTKKLAETDKQKLSTAEFIRKNIEKIKEEQNETESFCDKIETKKNELKDVEEKLSAIEEKNKEVENSAEARKKQELLENVSMLNVKLKTNSSLITNFFSPLEKALKKWNWSEKNKLAESYLENPVLALENDNNLEITNIMGKVKEDIIKNKLYIEERKKEQTFKSIEEITKEKLTSFIEEESKLKNELKKNEEELGKCKIEFLDNSKLLSEKNDILSEIEMLEKRQKLAEEGILGMQERVANSVKTFSEIKIIF